VSRGLRLLRIVQALNRPGFTILLFFGLVLGLLQRDALPSATAQCGATVALLAWMVASTALNDVADESIDRENLVDDARRVLVTGFATRRQLLAIAGAMGGIALGAASLGGWHDSVLVAVGLALSAGYSLPPLRLSDRGALTSVLLPVGYVAVPFLLGATVGSTSITSRGGWTLIGLFVALVGRLALKDFRDVDGDRLFGKRTLLVRYGRQRVCAVTAACYGAGLVPLLAITRVDATVLTDAAILGALTLVLVGRLAKDAGDDPLTISDVALLGRGQLVLVAIALGMDDHRLSAPWATSAALAVFVATLFSSWIDHSRYRYLPAGGGASAYPWWARQVSGAPVGERLAQVAGRSDDLVIDGADGITADWLSATTRRPWSAPRIQEIGVGRALLSRVFRVGDDEGSVIVKLPTDDVVQRLTAAALMAYERESAFYGAASTGALRAPRCHVAAATSGGTTIVLEDLGSDGFLDQLDGLPFVDVVRIADADAPLHSGPVPAELADVAWRLDDDRNLSLLSVALPAGVDSLQWLPLPARIGRFVDRFVELVPALLGDLAAEGALLHGDLRADNVRATDGDVAFVDFQLLSQGSPFFDLAYLASQSASLTAGQHRSLLERHRRTLCANGRSVDRDDAQRHYRSSLLVCLAYPIVLAASVDSMPPRGRALVGTMLQRVVGAIDRCDALSLVDR
jgi:4-hydroxybenzoate polyprenyltransferase